MIDISCPLITGTVSIGLKSANEMVSSRIYTWTAKDTAKANGEPEHKKEAGAER